MASLALGLALVGPVMAGVAVAEPGMVSPVGPSSAAQAQLQVTSAFDKTSYHTGEFARVTVTITNVGDAAVDGVRGISSLLEPTRLTLLAPFWGELDTGVTIPAGGRHIQVLTGRVGNPNATEVTVKGYISTGSGALVITTASAAVVPTVGDVGGVVFRDVNGNEAVDPGEEAAGAEVNLGSTLYGDDTHTTTTDATGRFSLTGVATVPYRTTFHVPGWTTRSRIIEVDQGDANRDLRIPAVRPFTETMTAAIAFTKDSYQPGETAELKITLTNKGSVPLHGVIANCNHIGNLHDLGLDMSGWGDLSPIAAGVRVPANSGAVFTVSEKVPEHAIDYGLVRIACDFGFDDPEANVVAASRAKVPGRTGSIESHAFQDTNGSGDRDADEAAIAGVTIGLLDRDTRRVVAMATADGTGLVRFTDVPAGQYGFHVFGSWRKADDDQSAVVKANGCLYGNCTWDVRVVPSDR
ncbi:SdrD B-like domain-containing protein [Goodfellowiella coeruleoviolacea]|uniref:SdrD B-like domain-containing protein n=1 Tax=Goodfellowiella coeruleoviolacea TaxID=334858 RepID=UPI0020A42527|nr:SdrD B-like domain-containing protein [Goodfellowiella coeruleoviolacea]